MWRVINSVHASAVLLVDCVPKHMAVYHMDNSFWLTPLNAHQWKSFEVHQTSHSSPLGINSWFIYLFLCIWIGKGARAGRKVTAGFCAPRACSLDTPAHGDECERGGLISERDRRGKHSNANTEPWVVTLTASTDGLGVQTSLWRISSGRDAVKRSQASRHSSQNRKRAVTFFLIYYAYLAQTMTRLKFVYILL